MGSAQEGLVQTETSMQGPVYSHLISLPGTLGEGRPRVLGKEEYQLQGIVRAMVFPS